MPGITVYIRREFEGITCPSQNVKKLIRAVCRQFNLKNVLVSIAIVDNKQIRKLNERFLRRKKNTDCLSFDLSQSGVFPKLFDIIVNGQLAKTEAVKRGHSARAELMLYITHGLLHNLGFDDHSISQAKEMHRFEDEILQSQGFGQVYESKNITGTNKRHKNAD
jgi:probable rRNA maturation factor